MIKRPAPKKLSVEAQNAILQASSQQTGKAVRVRSYDPDYPVFEVPINQKILVYIPNHTVQQPDGSMSLRMDIFAAHPVIDGRSYEDIRCNQGVISDEIGLDGTCPLCDGLQDCWTLYNYEYADIAKSKGIDSQSDEAKEALKSDRMTLANNRVIKEAVRWYTFPIVVIDCEEREGKLTTVPKKNADGQIKGTPMWYQIRESTYLDKWGSAFEVLEDEEGGVPTHPGGRWAILNFTYTSKSGKYDKMGSAKNLKVTFKAMKDFEYCETYFDQLTADWTPAKAMEVLVLNGLRDNNEMSVLADGLLKGVRNRIDMYELSKAGGAGIPAMAGGAAQSAENALADFGGVPVEQMSGEIPVNLTGEMPNMGVE